jgi:cytoskeletal protein RodZ
VKLFRRNKQTVAMPPEVAEYYQAERRDRRGVTLLLTFLALCVTVAIIVGLFLAGRWIYRSVQGDSQDKTAQTSETNTDGEDHSANDSGSTNDSNSNSNSASDSDQAQNDQNIAGDDSASDNDTSGDDSSSSSGSSADDSATTDENVSTQGSGAAGSSDNLTNTGPGETALAAFAGGSVIGYVIYRRRLLRTSK